LATSELFDVCVIATGAGGGVMLDRLTATLTIVANAYRVADQFAKQARSHSL
jgi:hypothetical protein